MGFLMSCEYFSEMLNTPENAPRALYPCETHVCVRKNSYGEVNLCMHSTPIEGETSFSPPHPSPPFSLPPLHGQDVRPLPHPLVAPPQGHASLPPHPEPWVRKRSSPFPVWFWVFVLFVFFVCVSLRFVRVALVASSRQLGPSGVRLS